jgi:hypothetical protein
LDPSGYGALKLKGKKVNTHRLAYELVKGEIPDGMCVCHSCDNRKCIEISHLWLGSKADNNRDMGQKGRAVSVNGDKTHCPKGHEYTPSNTRLGINSVGGPSRTCKTCHREINREHMRRVRAQRKIEGL